MGHRLTSEGIVRVADLPNRMDRRRLYRHGGPGHKYCGDGWGLLVPRARREERSSPALPLGPVRCWVLVGLPPAGGGW